MKAKVFLRGSRRAERTPGVRALLCAAATLLACEQIVDAEFEGWTVRDKVDAAAGSAGHSGQGAGGGANGGAAAGAGSEPDAGDAADTADTSASGGMGTDAGAAGSDGSAGTDGVGATGPNDAAAGGSAGASGDTGLDGGLLHQRVGSLPADNAVGFGVGVALAGDWALVGARDEDVYDFAWFLRRQANGEWALKQKVSPPGEAGLTTFGNAVALDERSALVGAFAGGKVFCYTRSSEGESWAYDGQLAANPPTPNDRFGVAVAVQGETAAVAATGTRQFRGAVHLYRRRAGWEFWQTLAPETLLSFDIHGQSLALDGNVLVACAPGDDTQGPEAGAGFVYERSGESWRLREKLLATEAGVRGFCGSVALRGDTLVVGAAGAGEGRGAAYVYTRQPGESFGDRLPQLLTPPSNLVAPRVFGIGVALCDSAVLIGHRRYAFEDSAFVYRRSSGVWSLAGQLGPTGSEASQFGDPISCSGRTALIGNQFDDGGGAVYFFDVGF